MANKRTRTKPLSVQAHDPSEYSLGFQAQPITVFSQPTAMGTLTHVEPAADAYSRQPSTSVAI